jgi:hypothetical protein
MSEAEFLTDGWEKINLNEGNVTLGDNIVNGNGCFGTLKKITKKGKYAVRFDMDYSDEPLTKFSPAKFERFFLVDKR